MQENSSHLMIKKASSHISYLLSACLKSMSFVIIIIIIYTTDLQSIFRRIFNIDWLINQLIILALLKTYIILPFCKGSREIQYPGRTIIVHFLDTKCFHLILRSTAERQNRIGGFKGKRLINIYSFLVLGARIHSSQSTEHSTVHIPPQTILQYLDFKHFMRECPPTSYNNTHRDLHFPLPYTLKPCIHNCACTCTCVCVHTVVHTYTNLWINLYQIANST